MTKIEKSVIIGVPLEKVYAFAVDWRSLKRYFVYVDDIKPTTEKTIGEGARFTLRVKFLGRMMTSEWECTEHVEKVGWTFNVTLMGRTAVKRWRFASVNSSTKVTFTLEYKPSPPLIGQLFDVLLIKPEWKRLYERSFNELKRLMEAETATTPSPSTKS